VVLVPIWVGHYNNKHTFQKNVDRAHCVEAGILLPSVARNVLQKGAHVRFMNAVDRSIDHVENTVKLGTYEEHGWYARVAILADQSDAHFERYTLQVYSHLTPNHWAATLAIGSTFRYMRRRNVMCWGMPRVTLDDVSKAI
jgi:hypothetical protein